MLLELREFKIEDLRTLTEDMLGTPPADSESIGRYNKTWGPCYTGFYKGQMLGAAGVRMMRPGVGTVWMVMTRHAVRYIKSIIETLHTMLPILIRVCQLKVIRASCRAEFGQGQRFLEFMGFKQVRRFCGYDYYRLTTINHEGHEEHEDEK